MTDAQYQALMTGRPLWDERLRDEKPARRIKASPRDWLRIRATKLNAQRCRICSEKPAESLHHICPKSLRGDDVAENMVGLCGDGTTGCHGLVEARDGWACSLLGQRLTAVEREYVLEKKGSGFLARYYGVKEAA